MAVVTGATSGIGREIARGLASRGFQTVVVGRGRERVATTAAEIARSTGNLDVEGLTVSDLGVRAQAHALALELADRHPAIHVLVNNAGGYFARREVTPDGVERTFALNVLAPLSLTRDLTPSLRAGAPSRVVNVASAAHRGYRVNLADLEGKERYRGFGAYGRSKLELILLTRELARRLQGSGVAVLSVHPGFVASGFGMNNRGVPKALVWLASRAFGKRPRSGARTPLAAASEPRFEGVTGAYISGGKVVRGSSESQDAAMARRLYEACVGYLGPSGGIPGPKPP